MHEIAVYSLVFAAVASTQAPPARPDHRAERFMVPIPGTGLRVLLRHQAAGHPRGGASPVLFIHGASFPSALAAAFPLDGTSWMDDLATRGFDVWALDFLGFGDSDRYPATGRSGADQGPLGRSAAASRQIAAAVEFIAAHQRASRVSLVAHSWGTIPAGSYAGDSPDRIDRLVLFGPVTRREQPPEPPTTGATWFVTVQAQRDRFYGYVPAGEAPVFDPTHFAVWGPAYLATDPRSATRAPPSVEVPSGPIADAQEAWAGHLQYDPGRITAPVLIVRGAWDSVTEDADAAWLFAALRRASRVRDVKISRGTHVMHLEAARHQLYDEVATFLTPP